jgi:hypothetical protein
MSMTDGLVTADTLHEKMEDAIRKPKGNGFVDCLVHFARMVEGTYMPGDVEEIIENDLDDCTPAYAKEYRKTWAMLDRKLTKITEGE